MVYKKYIKKDGKLYGPYHYHSYRDETGRVRTKYHGAVSDGKNKAVKKSLLLGVLIAGIAVILLFAIYLGIENLPEKQHSAASAEISRGITGFASKFYSFVTGFLAKEDEGSKDKEDKTDTLEEKTGKEDKDSLDKEEKKAGEEQAVESNDTAEIVEEFLGVLDEYSNETITEINETAEEHEPFFEEELEEAEPPAAEEQAVNETKETKTCVYGVVCGQWSDACIEEQMERDCVTTYADCSTTLMTEKEECVKIYNLLRQEEDARKEQEKKKKEKGNETEFGPEPPGALNNTFLENITNIVVNETTEENITLAVDEGNLTTTISTMQYGAILGKPVRWLKDVDILSVSGNQTKKIIIELPNLAGNISVKKIDEITGEQIELSVNTQNENNVLEVMPTVALTGNAAASFFRRIAGAFAGITGRVVDIVTNADANVTVEIQEIIDENTGFEVEYYTDAPYAEEIPLKEGFSKQIRIIGPDSVHYENILAFSQLPAEVAEAGEIKVYWNNNGTKQEAEFAASDTDNNSLLDSVEWIVPGLSEQVYEIILITSALHLDENRTIISDIYDEVRAQDDVWSEEIPSSHYVRVTFERQLDRTNDITVFARSVGGNSGISVYIGGGSESVAIIENISSSGFYKTYLTGLAEEESYSTFDLNIFGDAGAGIEFDYIVDPTTPPNLTIIFPVNSTTYAFNVTQLNYTVSDPSLQACWYSLDNGATNTTITCGQNATDLSGTNNWNTWTIWANDSTGNINSSAITFHSSYITECGVLGYQNTTYSVYKNIQISSSTCFNITADNVTLDLNGYTIDGDDIGGDSGVYIDGYNYTTIKNGRITDFGDVLVELSAGITSSNNKNLTIYNVTATSNFYGIKFFKVTYSNVSSNQLVSNTNDGMYMGSCSNNIIEYNNASNNVHYQGISLAGSMFNTIRHNVVNNNSVNGIILYSGSNNNSVYNITANDNAYGIRIWGSNNNSVYNITANDNAYGVYLVSASNNTLSDITTNLNSIGIFLDSGSDYNTFYAISASSNDAYGIALLSSSNNTLYNAISSSNTIDGVYLDSGSANNSFYNLNSYNNTGNEILDTTGASFTNYLIYNNSFGEIAWTNSSFLQNLTTEGTLTFPGNITISNNSAYFNPTGFTGNINSSANVTLNILGWGITNPRILKDGSECNAASAQPCSVISYNSSTGIIVFNVLSWSNYTIGETPNTTSIILNATSRNNFINDDLKCYANIADADGGDVYANYTWYKNNIEQAYLRGQSSAFSQGTLSLISTLASSNLSVGSIWICSVLGYDSQIYESGWSNSTGLSIVAGCGDGSCNNGETCNDCQNDCGVCGGGSAPPAPPETPPAEEPPVEEPPVEELPVEELPAEEEPEEELEEEFIEAPEAPPAPEQIVTLREKSGGIFGLGASSCSPDFKCQSWNECQGEYDAYNLISGLESKGTQARLCTDLNGCKSGFVETRICIFKVPVIIETKEWCNEEYTEIRKPDGEILARLKKGGNETIYLGVNLNLVGSGYCDYCYNRVQDYDEQGVDCGGSCVSCGFEKELQQIKILAPNFDYIIWFILSMVLLVLTLAYTVRNIIISCRTGEIDDLLKRYKKWKAQGYDVSVLEHHLKEHLHKYGA